MQVILFKNEIKKLSYLADIAKTSLSYKFLVKTGQYDCLWLFWKVAAHYKNYNI
jgi:hypothetical protein